MRSVYRSRDSPLLDTLFYFHFWNFKILKGMYKYHEKTDKTLCLFAWLWPCAQSLLPAAHGATAPLCDHRYFRKASLDLYKYDFTSANEAGILEWDTYVSTGLPDKAVEAALAPYAIQGVVFSLCQGS